MMPATAISVVIATRNRDHDLAECLRALVRADNGLLQEVIVVDDDSQPASRLDPALARAARVTLLRNDRRRGASASRNRAGDVATGDVLGFVDDDARVLPNWFEVAGAELTADRAAITGRVLPFDTGLVSRARQWRYDQRYQRLQPGTAVSFLAGGNSLVRRAAFLAAGGFPDQPTAADNALVPRLRAAGGDCCFVPELGILHRNGKGLAIAVREAWRAGASSPAPVDRALASMVGTLRTLPAADPEVALVNGVLQVVNTLGQLTGIGDGRRDR
jgi:GT2 family glycosyltransferase